MAICPFCAVSVDDKSTHYAGDACPAIVAAFGPVTAEGQQQERDTHYQANNMERAAKEMHDHSDQAQKTRKSNRLGFVAAATKCRECGEPVWRNGRCEQHEREHNNADATKYYYANRDRINREAREKRAATR